MRSTLLFVSFVLGTLALQAGIKVDIVAVTQEEVQKKTIPVIHETVPMESGGLVVKLTLKEPFGVIGEFAAYELRVSKKPIVVSALKRDFYHLDSFARREVGREKTVEFELKREEVPMSYVVISSWTGQRAEGMPTMRSLCLPVRYLVGP